MAEFDTTNATAKESDILNGKTAYAKGEKIKGTIQSKLGGSFTPAAEPQVICPAGVYTSSAYSIKGDANLKPENIRKGVEIFGVEGNAAVNDTPSGSLPDNMRTISVESNNHDGGTIYGGGAVSEGMIVTVSANPVGNFKCYGWWENGVYASEDAEYTFQVESSRNLKAMFSNTGHKPMPTGYTEVEWIQNNSLSSYFNIKDKRSNSAIGVYGIRIDVSFPNGIGTNLHIFEMQNTNASQNYVVYDYLMRVSDTTFHWYYTADSGYLTQKEIGTIEPDENGIYNLSVGSSMGTNVVRPSSPSINIPSSTSSSSQIMRIHYVRIYEDELIPCIRDKDGIVGLYDLQENEFIEPASGTFTAGPVIDN